MEDEYCIYDLEDDALYVNRTWSTKKEAIIARDDLVKYCSPEWQRRLQVREHDRIRMKLRAYDAPVMREAKINNEI